MRGGLSREQNVCLSVRPSVKRVNCDKKRKKIDFLHHMKERLS